MDERGSHSNRKEVEVAGSLDKVAGHIFHERYHRRIVLILQTAGAAMQMDHNEMFLELLLRVTGSGDDTSSRPALTLHMAVGSN